MKRILLAGAAIATLGTAAWAIDGDKQQTRVQVMSGSHVMVGGEGPIVEIRGADGERTLHMERDGAQTVITVNGQTIEIDGGRVTIDGETVEASPHSVVILEGDEIRVTDNVDARFGQEWTMRMAERADHMARLQDHMQHRFAFVSGDGMTFDLDIEGVHEEALAAIERSLEELEGAEFNGRDWDDLSEEEREEVREELREAREEMRESMREAREEMREAMREARDADEVHREVRIEMRRAAREMAEAEREMARAEREIARAHRDMARHENRRVEVIRRLHGDEAEGHANVWIERDGDHDIHFEERDVRIEQDEDGRRRVWINGEEQTGDDLTNWLNQLESERLAGARADGERRRRVERVELTGREGDRRLIELRDGHRVVELLGRDGERQVIELDGADGERRVIEFGDGRRVIFIERHETQDENDD
jgi:hypothetical protein